MGHPQGVPLRDVAIFTISHKSEFRHVYGNYRRGDPCGRLVFALSKNSVVHI